MIAGAYENYSSKAFSTTSLAPSSPLSSEFSSQHSLKMMVSLQDTLELNVTPPSPGRSLKMNSVSSAGSRHGPSKLRTTSVLSEKRESRRVSRTSQTIAHKDGRLMPASSLRRGASGRSTDTASVYSVASATMDLHDRMFRPMSLDPAPSETSRPASLPASHFPNPKYSWPPPRVVQASVPPILRVRAELAQDVYPKARAHPQAQHRLSNRSPTRTSTQPVAIPPVPPLPESMRSPQFPARPPPVAIRGSPSFPSSHSRSLSADLPRTKTLSISIPSSASAPYLAPPPISPRSLIQIRRVAPAAPSTSQNGVSTPPPELPARSPLRSLRK